MVEEKKVSKIYIYIIRNKYLFIYIYRHKLRRRIWYFALIRLIVGL